MAGDKGTRVTVYGLCSSEDGELRYIGQTTKSLRHRLMVHLQWQKREDNYRSRWIASVLRNGYEIEIFPIKTDAVLHEDEVQIIREYKAQGINLVNSTLGGDGWIGIPKLQEHKDKIAAAHRGTKKPWNIARNKSYTGTKRAPLTEEHKAKVSAGNKGKAKPFLIERNKSVVWTGEMRAKVGAANRGRKVSPEVKARLSAQRKGKSWTKARRDAHRNFSEESRQRISAASRAMWARRKQPP